MSSLALAFTVMRELLTVCCLVSLVGCIGARGRPEALVISSEGGRVYALGEAEAKAQVIAAFKEKSLTLFETDNPHILSTEPVVRPNAPARSKIDHAQTWLVVFEPLKSHATGVKVMRGEQFVWAEQASYFGPKPKNIAYFGPSSNPLNLSEPERLDPRIPPTFVRDPEKEALIAASLDGQVDVNVGEAGGPPAPLVLPLKDPEVAQAQAPNPALEPCGLESSELAPSLAPGHFVLLSDPIGAVEPWSVLEQVACLAREKGLAFTVALAIPTAEQRALNVYLSSNGDASAQRTLLAAPFWNRDWQDGRSSQATFDGLEQLRMMRSQGVAVTVLAADIDVFGNKRQAHVAAALLRHRAENPNRAIIAMLGNAMTTQRIGAEWDETLLPVGARLAAVLPAVTHSFDSAFEPGAHWTCKLGERGALRCGTWPALPGPPQTVRAVTSRPFFRTFASVSPHGFNGIYSVGGRLTPSSPAVSSRRIDQGVQPVRQNHLEVDYSPGAY